MLGRRVVKKQRSSSSSSEDIKSQKNSSRSISDDVIKRSSSISSPFNTEIDIIERKYPIMLNNVIPANYYQYYLLVLLFIVIKLKRERIGFYFR